MKMRLLLITVLLLITSRYSVCQGNMKADPVAGTWKGSSLCQDRNSPCHDEIAVYHATRLTPTSYRFQMNKMVNGKEEEMGPLVFTWNDTLKTLTAINKSARGTGKWNFRLDGNKMHGTLTVENTLFRIVELQKE